MAQYKSMGNVAECNQLSGNQKEDAFEVYARAEKTYDEKPQKPGKNGDSLEDFLRNIKEKEREAMKKVNAFLKGLEGEVSSESA